MQKKITHLIKLCSKKCPPAKSERFPKYAKINLLCCKSWSIFLTTTAKGKVSPPAFPIEKCSKSAESYDYNTDWKTFLSPQFCRCDEVASFCDSSRFFGLALFRGIKLTLSTCLPGVEGVCCDMLITTNSSQGWIMLKWKIDEFWKQQVFMLSASYL